ncbi:hypothetical protein ACHWQZ_G017272 [Mnemiopsis leidyi]
MSSSYWLDDIILPKKGKEVKPAEYAFSADTVILNEADQKSYMLDCDDTTTLQLQIETAEGPRVIPISGQHIITTADGQQFLSGGVLPEEQPGYLHTVEGGQTFILSTEQGGQQIYQDSTGQQYIICDVANTEQTQTAAPVQTEEPGYTNIDSFISKVAPQPIDNSKPLVKLPSGQDGEYITYEVDCQLEDGSEPPADKNILDQDKLANLLNVLQTGEHGQALSNADLFILAPPEHQQSDTIVPDFDKTATEHTADTGDIITNLKPEPEVMAPTKYVAVKMKKSDLTVSNGASAARKSNDKECVIKNTHKRSNRKITDYSDGFVKSRPAEETKADWEYSVWSGAGAQQPPAAKRKRGAPKKERSETKQSKLEQMTLDVGQKVEPTQCTQCGMVYNHAVPDDEQNHNKYHKRFLKASSFSGWKTERVVEEYHDGRIILVNQHDPKSHVKKMEEVREVVDIDLGITDRNQNPVPGKELQAFLYISNANKVIAAAFVEHIEKGYPCVSAHEPDETGKAPLLKSDDVAMKAVCGISRLWVFKQCRRKKIASRLMDCVRANLVFGCTISKVKIAFSDPTENGRMFAQTYCGTPNFLIYR